MVIPAGNSGAACQVSTGALKKRRQRAKYSLEKQKSPNEAAEGRMKKERDLNLLDTTQCEAQRDADKVRKRE